MKRRVVIFGAFLLLTFAQRPAFAGTVMYDSIPAPFPVNVPSLGYQANQTAEFGDLINFADGTSRNLWSVTAVMSDWALAPTGSTDPGWSHPITLNLYNVANVAGTLQPGTVIASVTQTFFIPWRPVGSGGCPDGGFLGSDNACHGGLAFEVTFNLGNIGVPDQLIYGIAFNTNTWGYNPIGQPGPYESLNFGLNTVAPTVGSNPLPDTAYWNTMTAANYTDHGAGGIGTFRQDTAWSPYIGAVEFDSVPEPGTVGLMLGGGMLILAGAIRRKRPGKR